MKLSVLCKRGVCRSSYIYVMFFEQVWTEIVNYTVTV